MDTDEEFNGIVEKLNQAEKLEDTLWEIEAQLLEAFGAERFTIYQKDESGKEIVSWYRTSTDSVDEIRLYMSPSSLAGFVAMTQQALMVDDAYDSEYLESVDPELVLLLEPERTFSRLFHPRRKVTTLGQSWAGPAWVVFFNIFNMFNAFFNISNVFCANTELWH